MKIPGITTLGIALFVLPALASTNAAADDAQESLPLKMQSWLFPFEGNQNNDLPVYLDAQQLSGHTDTDIDAQGGVQLRRHGQSFSADTMLYDKEHHVFDARGNVRIEQNGDALMGDGLHYDLQTEQGALEAPHYEIHNTANMAGNSTGLIGYGSGSALHIESKYRYSLEDATYTTCGPDDPDWIVRASKLTIDKERQIGTARNARFDFMGVPLFYTPYLSFSLDRGRKSGFLSPSFGDNTRRGFEINLPFYWNIAPNYDLTLTPREMTKRGVQFGADFRYLEPGEQGRLRYQILPQDQQRADQQRDLLFYEHQQRWHNWYGAVDIKRVSDSNYFTDLSSTISMTSLSVLPGQGMIGRGGAWGSNGIWNISAMVQHWQTLQPDPTQPVTPPYDRAPQLTLTANKQDIGPLNFDFTSAYTNFTHPTLVNGQRTVMYPSLSLPLQTSFVYLTPKIGWHATHYQLDSSTTTLPTSTDRTMPIFSADSGMTFERDTHWGDTPITQTLEPRAYYVYIPARGQNQLPNFDSAPQDLNFATLFTENQFSGNDRINDANQLTTGAISRFIDGDGDERLRLGLAQRFYFSEQAVTLPGVAARNNNASDLLALVSGNVTRAWSVDAGWQYTTDLGETQRLMLGTRYQPSPEKLFNISYRYTRDTLRQVDVSSRWPLTRHFGLVGRWNYSLQDHRILETLGGLEYNNGCCWALRGVAHSYVTTTQTRQTAFMVMIELNGLSDFGSNPTRLLSRNVGGYSWQSMSNVDDDDPLAR